MPIPFLIWNLWNLTAAYRGDRGGQFGSKVCLRNLWTSPYNRYEMEWHHCQFALLVVTRLFYRLHNGIIYYACNHKCEMVHSWLLIESGESFWSHMWPIQFLSHSGAVCVKLIWRTNLVRIILFEINQFKCVKSHSNEAQSY